jgi:hypothetical protein
MQQKKVRELLSALVNLVSIAEIVTVLPESNAPRVAFKMKSDTWVLFCDQDKINYIVGDDFDSRLEVEKSIKKLYARRSAVAHGGSQSVLESEVIEALKLVRNLIKRITTNPELSAMTSMRQLQEWVLRKKHT